jgi:hypothetical protein
MTRDDIIRMARESSFTENSGFDGCFVCNPHSLERFAALVAAAEREACAKLCDDLSDQHSWEGCYADECATAIRARGQQ